VAIVKDGTVIDLQNVAELRRSGYKKVARGPVTEVVGRIDRLGVTDVFIEEPTLEEIFLHYYQ
jgi:hypothetical protein